MITKQQVSDLRALQQKKVRRETGLFTAEGVKIVQELLGSSLRVRQIFALQSWLETNRGLLKNVDNFSVSPAELERISGLVTPNEVLAVCEIPAYTLDSEKLPAQLTLALDDIRDPGNLGTIIRIADWFGIPDIICSASTAEAWNPKTVQSSMGSIARVRIHYKPLPEFLRELRTEHPALPICGALLEGENVYTEKLQPNGILVIGNEAHGISPEAEKELTQRLRIPSFSTVEGKAGEAESLNAAVATAIFCSEFRRR